jgi:hypothetical protein
VERRVVIADPGDGSAHLPQRDAADRRGDPRPVLHDRVDHGVLERRDVARTDVVVAAPEERRVEHLLMVDERLGSEQIQDGRAEGPHGP